MLKKRTVKPRVLCSGCRTVRGHYWSECQANKSCPLCMEWCHNCGDVAYCAECKSDALYKEALTLRSYCIDCRAISNLDFIEPFVNVLT